jgi:predicted enzyme related to lactoylglutathione lyase
VNSPTLEIYSYSITADPVRPEVNRPGFAHIAFVVPDVRTAQQEVINKGGGTIGDIVTLETTTGVRVTWCYVRDPEGNIIELQSWS